MAHTPEVIRGDIEQTRAQMGDTLDALAYKANVPARAKGWFGRKAEAVGGAWGTGVSTLSTGLSSLSGATDSMVSKVSGVAPSTGQIQEGAGRMKDTAERNPLGLAIFGAAVGFAAGLFAPSSRIESEKLGPISDQLKDQALEAKDQALEAGQEALDRGKQVVQAAVESAVATGEAEGKQQGNEFASSLQERARGFSQNSE